MLTVQTSVKPLLLVNGDRLTRPDFHRRYRALPPGTRAELIEGTVYMASPLRCRAHGQPHFWMITWLGVYAAATPGTEGGDNTTVWLDLDNEVQPDAFLRIQERAGGRSSTTEDDYVQGPPELIVEIAATSANIDLHQKKEAYRRNGVQEYMVWRTDENRLDWWQLLDGKYANLVADEDGVIHSQIFPGLVLDVPALLQGRLADVLARQQLATSSAEHAAFAARLQASLPATPNDDPRHSSEE